MIINLSWISGIACPCRPFAFDNNFDNKWIEAKILLLKIIYSIVQHLYNTRQVQFSRMFHSIFQVQYVQHISRQQIILMTDDICWCQWSCGRTLRKSPSCKRTPGSSASSPGAPKQQKVLQKTPTSPKLSVIIVKAWTDVLPSACRFCTF